MILGAFIVLVIRFQGVIAYHVIVTVILVIAILAIVVLPLVTNK
jgi:hypothetical protein